MATKKNLLLQEANALQAFINRSRKWDSPEELSENERRLYSKIEKQVVAGISSLLKRCADVLKEMDDDYEKFDSKRFVRRGEVVVKEWETCFDSARNMLPQVWEEDEIGEERHCPHQPIDDIDLHNLRRELFLFTYKPDPEKSLVGATAGNIRVLTPLEFTYDELVRYFVMTVRFIYLSLYETLSYWKPSAFPSINYQLNKKFFEFFSLQEPDIPEKIFLYKDEGIIRACYDILIDIDAIDEDFNYTGKVEKGVFVIWLNELQKRTSNRPSIVASLKPKEAKTFLEQKFNGLKMDISNLQPRGLDRHKKAEEDHGERIREGLRTLRFFKKGVVANPER